MTNTEQKVIRLLTQYGMDFFLKLSLYKTARYCGNVFEIRKVNLHNLTLTVWNNDAGEGELSILDMEDFCL